MNQTTTADGQKLPQTRRELITSIRAKADAKKSWSEHLADRVTSFSGTVTFLAINVVFFVVWVLLNAGMLAGMEPFNPFPFVLLTTAVSLEAIMLSILVLISENRASKVAELREEVSLQLNVIEEQEITKILHLLVLLLEKTGVDVSQDEELQAMIEQTDTERIEATIEKQLY